MTCSCRKGAPDPSCPRPEHSTATIIGSDPNTALTAQDRIAALEQENARLRSYLARAIRHLKAIL